MSNVESIINRLKSVKHVLEKEYAVKEIGVFGSYAKGDATEISDIDILVEFEKPLGWKSIELELYLEKLLGKKIDLVTKKALKPVIKDDILKSVLMA
jgi:predicted nucleotidyltransferase